MINRVCTVIALLSLLTGCVTQTVKTTAVPTLKTYTTELASDEILDVAVVVFDPGLMETDPENSVYPEIRRAEATFMARELALVLDDQGAWGASRVVPSNDHIADVLINGTIEQSDGESLTLYIRATDAQGRTWLDKRYAGTTSRYAYQQTQRVKKDPFLAIYRDVANDLLAVFQGLSRNERLAIRDVAKLKFARTFAPAAFKSYLLESDSDLTRAVRLPAESDPMMSRIGAIRQRNHVFVDTLQGHYDNFSGTMNGPYTEWRRLSYEETVSLRQLESEARTQLLVGGLSVLAGIAAATSDDRNVRTAGAVGIYAGGGLVKSGLERRAEANIHSLALEELGQSLEAEITPQVIELEDRTVQLSGTIDDQYSQWREILSDIYAAEIADLPTEVAPPAQ
ncbi:hypothetical protein N8718_03770 [Luminiphilus sp.]|nr:hypothetical protein [Luminiphilus sp.]